MKTETAQKAEKTTPAKEYSNIKNSRNKNSVRQKTKPVLNDREYFDRWTEFFNLLNCRIHANTKQDNSNAKTNIKNKSDKISIKEIRSKEADFWRSVEEGINSGKSFAVEEFAHRFKLDKFQKKVVLSLLNFELEDNSRNKLTANHLINFLEYSSSPFEKLLKKPYFVEGSSLMDNDILEIAYDFHSNRGAELCLNPSVKNKLCRLFAGEKIKWNKNSGDTDERSLNLGVVRNSEYVLEDVVLDEMCRTNIQMFLEGYKNRDRLKAGIQDKGLTFLFYGPPGTGKSMLGDAIGNYTGKKIIIVKYEKIMDKWVGETEKKIAELFDYSLEKDLVVILDEADSLVYDRKKALHEAATKFTNIVLRILEKYSGIVVLTTNMDCSLDTALERRVTYKVKFENPDKEKQMEIWQNHVARISVDIEVPENIDFKRLADEFNFSGGDIKNAVQNACLITAAQKKKTLTFDELIEGAHLQSEGKYTDKSSSMPIKGFQAQAISP